MAKSTEKTICTNCNGEGSLVSENFPLPYTCPVCGGTGTDDAK